MKDVYIVAAVRTPIGSFGGSLASLSATALGAKAIAGAIAAARISPDQVQEVIMGNVVSANLGQAPARQAALGAGLPFNVPCTTVNKVCSSGMKAIIFGAQSIALGQADLIVAGGMESMTNIPFYASGMRWGTKFGNSEFIDGLMKDGLTDVYNQTAMGVSADKTAEKYGISRESQDAFAIDSYKRSQGATNNGTFKNEIVPIEIAQRKGPAIVIDKDEEPFKVDFDKIPSLRPSFSPEGTVTAANASTLNDGAAAIILASEEAIKKYSLTPLARIVSYADAEQDPFWFTTTPTLAAPLALKRANLNAGDIDFYEVNEAFAVVTLAFEQVIEVAHQKVNIHGGACSLGHPLGASGARIVTTLTHILQQNNGKYGLATLCNGGGGASALIIEKV
ncbi:MAG TPA: acetyl-CoA C-acyltransferase [Saprospiraceae bacterium]|nr:acetyl-CoA C-acyltransferase [Saprospiraceae bacterium]